MTKVITSQDYLNEEIVAEKVAQGDFDVFVSPAFQIDGEYYRVLLDGHHSFAAAKVAGVAPVLVEQDATNNDNIALLDAGDVDTFLQAVRMDSDYRFADTGAYVW